jgi:hypothetical protein
MRSCLDTQPFLCDLFRPRIFRFAVVMIAALGWSVSALCGPIHDAARQGNLAAAQALQQNNPHLAVSKDSSGNTPLHLAAMGGFVDVESNAGLQTGCSVGVPARTYP